MGILTLENETTEHGLLRFSISELATLHGIASNLVNLSYQEDSNVVLTQEQFTVLYRIVGSVEKAGIVNTYEGENT